MESGTLRTSFDYTWLAQKGMGGGSDLELLLLSFLGIELTGAEPPRPFGAAASTLARLRVSARNLFVMVCVARDKKDSGHVLIRRAQHLQKVRN